MVLYLVTAVNSTTVTVTYRRTLRGGTVDSFHDHRIVMAAAIASLICSNPVVIRGFEAVNKSAPQFFNDFQALGGTVVEYVR